MNETKSLTSVTKGYAWMCVAVLIWASWLVLTSAGRTTALSVIDLAGFRALVPAIVLAPVLWRQRRDVIALGLVRCLLLSAYGAPFTLLVGYGLGFAPVAHAGALVPGLMPVFASILTFAFMGQRVTVRQVIATLLILLGAVALLLQASHGPVLEQMWIGHALFLAGAVCWACFAVTMRASDIPPFLATAIVAAISAVVLLPVWVLSDLSELNTALRGDIVFQAVFQGLIAGLLSLFAFGQALRLIGGQATVLSALTPGVAAFLAMPVLGQIPDRVDLFALTVVVAGLIIRATASSETLADIPPSSRPDVSTTVQKPLPRQEPY